MVLFKGRHRARWHQEIGVAIVGYRTLNAKPEQPPYCPLIQLQEHTNTYLRKVGRLTIGEQDAHLTTLVREHQDKDVAIIACAHALSPHCVRHLLRGELLADAHDRLRTSSYLRTLVATHHANPHAVGDLEAQYAQSLISLLFADVMTIVEQLRRSATCLRQITILCIPTDLFPPPVVASIPRRACEVLSGQLENMKLISGWKQAYQATSSLSNPSHTARSMEELLDSSFPDWRMWASWCPDIRRLEVWERLTPQQRHDLADILALEGPDFTGRGKPALREALLPQGDEQSGFSISHGRLRLTLASASVSDAQKVLGRLINILCTTCSISSRSAALFVHLCVHNPIDTTALQVLEYLNQTRESSLSKSILDMLTAPAASIRMSGVFGTLAFLNSVHHQALRDILSSSFISAADD